MAVIVHRDNAAGQLVWNHIEGSQPPRFVLSIKAKGWPNWVVRSVIWPTPDFSLIAHALGQ